jgi:beta-phosphoglucomutase-like phosphatase (HAD superfamily)
MSEFSLSPEDTLIIEDSPYGLLAAQRSGASIVRVKNSKDLTLEKIQSTKL